MNIEATVVENAQSPLQFLFNNTHKFSAIKPHRKPPLAVSKLHKVMKASLHELYKAKAFMKFCLKYTILFL